MSDFLTTWKRIVQDEEQAGTYWLMPNPETSRGGDAVEDPRIIQVHPHVIEDAHSERPGRVHQPFIDALKQHPTHHDDEHTGEEQHPHTD